MEDTYYMGLALQQAQKAAALGEVPVGAVVVREGAVIATGYNRREIDRNALAHAELLAIDAACKRLGGWRLFGCTLYVTLEPCAMCMGAAINARIDRIVYGACDPKAGSCGSLVAVSYTHLDVYKRQGYYIGFTGVVTFHNARKVAEAAKAVPSDRILVETDCPYMAPVPCRGKRCDSALLPYTIEALANMRRADAQQLTEQAANNTRALFGIAQK